MVEATNALRQAENAEGSALRDVMVLERDLEEAKDLEAALASQVTD